MKPACQEENEEKIFLFFSPETLDKSKLILYNKDIKERRIEKDNKTYISVDDKFRY